MLENPMLQERNEPRRDRSSPLAGYRSRQSDFDDEPEYEPYELEDIAAEMAEEIEEEELKEAV